MNATTDNAESKGEARRPARVFISYAHEDEDWREDLQKHLKQLERNGVMDAWDDRKIIPGQDWAGVINDNLKRADVVLLLISADFVDSDYCNEIELKTALAQHSRNQTVVIPVFVRAVYSRGSQFSHLQPLPTNFKPLDQWENRDQALKEVAEGILKAIDHFFGTQDGPSTGNAEQRQHKTVRPTGLKRGLSGIGVFILLCLLAVGAVKYDRSRIETPLALASGWMNLGQYELAHEEYLLAADRAWFGRWHPVIAEGLEKAVDFDGKESWQVALEVDRLNAKYPDDPQLLTLKGHVFAIDGKLEEALETWDKAMELDDGIAHTHFLMGYVYMLSNNCDAGIGAYEKAAQIAEQWPVYHVNLAHAYLRCGRSEQSVFHLNKSLQGDFVLGYLETARYFLDWVGNPANALEFQRQAVSLLEEESGMLDRPINRSPWEFANGEKWLVLDSNERKHCYARATLASIHNLLGVNDGRRGVSKADLQACESLGLSADDILEWVNLAEQAIRVKWQENLK